MGILSREQGLFELPLQVSVSLAEHLVIPMLQARAGQSLHIVVESQGRVCFGSQLADNKGILDNVTLADR